MHFFLDQPSVRFKQSKGCFTSTKCHFKLFDSSTCLGMVFFGINYKIIIIIKLLMFVFVHRYVGKIIISEKDYISFERDRRPYKPLILYIFTKIIESNLVLLWIGIHFGFQILKNIVWIKKNVQFKFLEHFCDSCQLY